MGLKEKDILKRVLFYGGNAIVALIFVGTFVFLYQKSQPKATEYSEFVPKMGVYQGKYDEIHPQQPVLCVCNCNPGPGGQFRLRICPGKIQFPRKGAAADSGHQPYGASHGGHHAAPLQGGCQPWVGEYLGRADCSLCGEMLLHLHVPPVLLRHSR